MSVDRCERLLTGYISLKWSGHLVLLKEMLQNGLASYLPYLLSANASLLFPGEIYLTELDANP